MRLWVKRTTPNSLSGKGNINRRTAVPFSPLWFFFSTHIAICWLKLTPGILGGDDYSPKNASGIHKGRAFDPYGCGSQLIASCVESLDRRKEFLKSAAFSSFANTQTSVTLWCILRPLAFLVCP